MADGQIRHDLECDYELMKCPIPKCSDLTCKAALVDHFKQRHHVQASCQNKFLGTLENWNAMKPFFSPVLITYNGQYFLVEVSKSFELYYIWVFIS